MTRPIIAITIGHQNDRRMLNAVALEKLATFAEVIQHPGLEPASKQALIQLLPQADACITSWDVAPLDTEVLQAAPRLKAMVHMGGSINHLVTNAVWERGIRVFGASPALAQDVAETTLGMIIVGMKRVIPLSNHVRDGGWRESPYWPARELHGKTVGIIGASHVGQWIIRLLEPFKNRVLLYDPYLPSEEAARLGAKKTELDELVQQADVISLHAPAKPETHHLLNARRLALMKDNALIVNTARGTLIDEEALIAELEKGRLVAILDVTDPEPPAPDSPLRKLENVAVTPHLAGCIEDCSRLSEMAAEELRRFFVGEPPLYEITPEMLSRIA